MLPQVLTSAAYLRNLALACIATLCCLLTSYRAEADQLAGIDTDFKANEITEQSGIVNISKNWEFYWQNTIEAGMALPKISAILNVDHSWNKAVLMSGETLGVFGYGTYRKILRQLPPHPLGYEIGLKGGYSAFKLIVYPDNHPEKAKIIKGGVVGTGDALGSRRPAYISVYPEQATDYVVLLQLANKDNGYGAVVFPVEIAVGRRISEFIEIEGIINLISLGVTLAVGIFSFMMWVRRHEDKPALSLALVAVGSILRVSSTCPFLLQFFPEGWYQWMIRAEYTSMPIGVGAYLFFLHSSFSPNKKSWTIRLLYLFSVILALVSMMSPVQAFTKLRALYQVDILLCGACYLWLVGRSIRSKQSGVKLVMIGCIIICGAFVYDIAIVTMQGIGILITPIAVMVFLLLNSQLIAQRFAETYRQSELISAELRSKNQHISEKYDEIVSLQIQVKYEQDTRNAMAAKTAHHLNNPFQALTGFLEANTYEIKTIQSSLEALFPPAEEHTPEIEKIIGNFRKNFQSIEENSAIMVKSLRRATTISKELGILSGIHGVEMRRLSMEDLWLIFIADFKEDDSLASRTIVFDSLSAETLGQEMWIEPVSFTRSIFYVMKEGIETLPLTSKISISAYCRVPGASRVLLKIHLTSAEGFRGLESYEWKELGFCRNILKTYSTSVRIELTDSQLIFEINIAQDTKYMSGIHFGASA